MVSDCQVKGLFKTMSKGKKLSVSALKSGMCENTARRYINLGVLPSDLRQPRKYRTHEDVFSVIWSEVVELLKENPRLEAKVIFEYILEKHPENNFQSSQLRTFQRKIKLWKAEFGGCKEGYFEQNHFPGVFCQSDFTSMNTLKITINGQSFAHILYHFVLTYSNWESADIASSESFESLSSGFQNAIFRLGGVPEQHQTDRLSAAVKNSTSKRDFTEKYKALLAHYEIKGKKTNPNSPNENGDVEQSNNRLKKAVNQQLMLRGSRDFTSREEYNVFLQKVIKSRNKRCLDKLQEELKTLSELPDKRLETCTKYSNIRVSKYSTIRIVYNTYSVHSRLINERITVLLFSEHLELWHSNKCIDKIPRLRGKNLHQVNYRHIIDILVKKPGAFENYKFRSDLFPSTHFRIAYDLLLKQDISTADSIYLKVLHFASKNNEEYVDRALKEIIDKDIILTTEIVKNIAESFTTIEKYEDTIVDQPKLSDYDILLSETELL